MLLDVAAFRRRVDFDLDGLVSDLQDETRRVGQSEATAWRVANPEHIHESAWKKTLSSSRKERGSGPNTDELVRRLQRGYRILLSRAIRGTYVWFEDEETRTHVEGLLAG